MRRAFHRVRASQLARNTCWTFLGQGMGIVVQALYFVLMARSLHSHGYGAFVGVVALVAIVAPFAGMGSGNLLIKNVARNADSFGRYWGRGIVMVLVSGTVILGLVLALSRLVLPPSIPLALVFVVGLTELLFARIHDLSSQAFQAFQRMERTAFLQFFPNLLKLVAIALLALSVEAPTVLQWASLYCVTTLVSMAAGIRFVRREIGPPAFGVAGMGTEIVEGFYFSIGYCARSVYNDIDKTMLARLATLEATGIYGAAYRVINVSFTPVLSLLFASYARFFQDGAAGLRGSVGLARRLFPLAGIYGAAAGLLLAAASPLLPMVLGGEYAGAAGALCWLAPLPFLKTLHFFTADALTGAGFQGVRSALQVTVASFNVGMNLWLIPDYSWRGAAWASLASDGLLAVLMCLAVFYLFRKQAEETSCIKEGASG